MKKTRVLALLFLSFFTMAALFSGCKATTWLKKGKSALQKAEKYKGKYNKNKKRLDKLGKF